MNAAAAAHLYLLLPLPVSGLFHSDSVLSFSDLNVGWCIANKGEYGDLVAVSEYAFSALVIKEHDVVSLVLNIVDHNVWAAFAEGLNNLGGLRTRYRGLATGNGVALDQSFVTQYASTSA